MSPFKGFKMPIEHRLKIAASLKGNKNGLGRTTKWSEESRQKRRIQFKGITWSPKTQFKKGQSAWNKGKQMPDSMREKMRIIARQRVGPLSQNWIDGRSFFPYPSVFNKVLKEEIRKRDNETCQRCGVKQADWHEHLSIHHIDYNKFNCSPTNMITLCRPCNSSVNFNRSHWTSYFRSKL